jgi:hypothetical protein
MDNKRVERAYKGTDLQDGSTKTFLVLGNLYSIRLVAEHTKVPID